MTTYRFTKLTEEEAIIEADSEDAAWKVVYDDESFGGDEFYLVDIEYQVAEVDEDGVVIDA